MIVRSLNPKKDASGPKEDDEQILGPQLPYLNTIGALIYLAQYTRPDIAISVNLLAQFNSKLTRDMIIVSNTFFVIF